MQSPSVARSTIVADVAATLAVAGRRERLARLTPALLAFVAAAGLLALAVAGG